MNERHGLSDLVSQVTQYQFYHILLAGSVIWLMEIPSYGWFVSQPRLHVRPNQRSHGSYFEKVLIRKCGTSGFCLFFFACLFFLCFGNMGSFHSVSIIRWFSDFRFYNIQCLVQSFQEMPIHCLATISELFCDFGSN